jgi:hypothetical protein
MNNSIFSIVIEEEEKMDKYTAGIIIGLLSAGLAIEAHALEEGLSPKGSVPLIYEYNLQGPATIESDSIKTQGTIKTIATYYEFEGEVRLEVSANAGTSYTKIINGAILKDGFIAGNELRFRANIAKDSTLKKLIIGYTDSSGVERLYRNPDLANYKYHKPIYISGGSEEVFNYPLKVGDTLPIEFKNVPVMFTAADGQTPLYYYVEQGLSPSEASGTVPEYWVKVPQIPKDGTMIHVYYNLEPKTYNLSKGTVPKFLDANKVFPFFDDFSDTNLNEEKWNAKSGLKKEYDINDGNLELKDCLIISRGFKIKQGIIEFKAKAEENASIQAILRAKATAHSLFPFEQMVYSSNYPGAEHTIAINDMAKLNIGKPIKALTYYIYKVIVNPQGIIFERYSENYEKQAEIQFLDVGNFTEGYIGLKADAAPFNAGSVYFDWVRVRPYVEVEPVCQSPVAGQPVKE